MKSIRLNISITELYVKIMGLVVKHEKNTKQEVNKKLTRVKEN